MRWLLTPPERVALKRVLKLLKLKKSGFALSVLYGVLGFGSAIGLAAVSAWLIARASQMPPVLYLSVAATSVRMFGVMRALMRYLQRLASHKVALEGMDSLRLGLYDSMMQGPIDTAAKLQRGDLLVRIGADIDAVGDYVVKSLLPFVVTTIVGAGAVIGFAFLSIPSAFILAAGLLISGLVAPWLLAGASREGELREQGARQQVAVGSLNILESADELAVGGRLGSVFKRLSTSSDELNAARGQSARPAAFAVALDRFAMGITVVGIFLVAIPETNAGLVAAVALAVLVLTPLAAFEGTVDLGPAAVQMVRSAVAAQRIVELLGPSGTQVVPAHPIPESAEGAVTLEATSLAVGWPGRPTTLSGVSFQVTTGDILAIVGESGIGKSTLLYTLAGMLPPVSGSATLNSTPTWRGDRGEVTSLVSLTTEDAHIFATTVFENLRVARADLTKECASQILGEVGLGPWLEGLPNGLETMLGVGATTISGGERRRLLLARALASPAPLLLLDEPGEHLDAKTAEEVLSSLFGQSARQRGLVVVTHHLSHLSAAGEVLQLASPDEGEPARPLAQGTHAQLLETIPQYRWAVEKE